LMGWNLPIILASTAVSGCNNIFLTSLSRFIQFSKNHSVLAFSLLAVKSQ